MSRYFARKCVFRASGKSDRTRRLFIKLAFKGETMSHEVTRIIPKKERCEFCHRKATLLCDMPVAEVCTSIDFKSYVRTCDKNLCEKCTTRVGVFDFCPACIKKIKSAKKGLNVDFGGKNGDGLHEPM